MLYFYFYLRRLQNFSLLILLKTGVISLMHVELITRHVLLCYPVLTPFWHSHISLICRNQLISFSFRLLIAIIKMTSIHFVSLIPHSLPKYYHPIEKQLSCLVYKFMFCNCIKIDEYFAIYHFLCVFFQNFTTAFPVLSQKVIISLFLFPQI